MSFKVLIIGGVACGPKTASRLKRLRPDAETGGPHVFTRSDGTTGARYEITAQSDHFLSSGNRPEGQEPGATGSEEEPKDQMGSGEDIPF